MYLRAEQRKREETADDDPGTDGLIASVPVTARTALDLIETVAIEALAAKRPPRPLAHRRAATLGAVAIVATLGVALTLSPGETSEEPTTTAVMTALAATPASAVTREPAAAPAKTESPATPAAAPPAATPARAASSPTAEPVRVTVPAKPAFARSRRTAAAAAATARASRALDGQLRITSMPAGARVTVDGIGWGQTPLTVGHLPFGTKTVRLTHDGYASKQAIVRISADNPRQSVNVGLRRR